MAKALRTVAVIAGAAATIAGGIALANPGLVLAGAKIGTIATVASAAATVTQIAARSLAKPKNDNQGRQLTYKIDPDGPIPFGMGRYATGGTVVHRNTYGKDNAYNTAFVVLGGGGPYAGIDTFLADRSPVSFSGTSALGYFSTWMWSDRQAGLTPEPDALTNGVPIAGQVPGWGAAYKLSGFAAASLTLKYDTKGKRYVQGEPLPGWIVRGMLVYDPAQDSTYPGGSGPCRWADPSDTAAHAAARQTWVYSNSPALHGLMWRLGIWARDENNPNARYQKIGGIGAPIDLIDLPAIVQARNVQIANGWTIGGEVNSDQDKWEVLKLIEQAGGCEPIAVGAKMSTLVKAPRVSLRTITPADLADGSISAPAMRARSERINGYRARFRSEPHGWEMTSIDIVQVPLYVAEDGRAKTGAGDFSLVTDPDQCAELAAYEVFDSRELEPITVNLKPFAVAYRLGDCLTLDIPEVGLESRLVIVRGRTVDPASGIVTLTCRSETTAKHPACLGLTGDTPPTPTLTSPPDSIDAPTAGAWSLAVPGENSDYVTPTIIVSGTVENAAADAVLIEYRQFGAPDWIGSGVDAPTTTTKALSGLLKATAYEVSIRYRGRGIFSDRLILGPVTAADISTQGADAFSVNLTKEASVLPADPDGNVTSYAGATTTIQINHGGQDVTALGWFTLIVPANPQNLTFGGTYPTYSVTGGFDAGEDVASLVLRLVGVGGTPAADLIIEKVWSFTKSPAGQPGASAPLIKTQWSVNGVDGWHDNFFGADQYYRQSNDGGLTYGPAIKGVGENGTIGADGTSATHIFHRSPTVPSTPVQNTGNPPPFWFDGPPAGTDFLWLSKATYRNGAQLTPWSAPQRISGENGKDGINGLQNTGQATTFGVYSAGNTGFVPIAATDVYVPPASTKLTVIADLAAQRGAIVGSSTARYVAEAVMPNGTVYQLFDITSTTMTTTSNAGETDGGDGAAKFMADVAALPLPISGYSKVSFRLAVQRATISGSPTSITTNGVFRIELR